MRPARPLILAIALTTITGLSVAVGWVALGNGLARITERAQSDLTLAADRLTAQLQRYRELAVQLADHPDLMPLVLTAKAPLPPAEALLRASADRSGSLEVALLDAAGRMIATSADNTSPDAAQAPHFRRAMQGGLGFRQAVDPQTGQRQFLFAAPIFAPAGPVTGAILVRFAVDRIEANWRAAPETVFFTDAAGVIFVSNRSELVFATRLPEHDLPQSLTAMMRAIYPAGLLHPFVPHELSDFQGHDLWQIDGGPYLPSRALHLAQPLPVAGLTAEILLDVGPTLCFAFSQALVTAAALLVAGSAFLMLADRRRALADRLALEETAKTQLERRVAARTRDLSLAVDRLRAEVLERQEAEAALRRAQQELVQAGKLSALGQMSAGLSHELNQPLMAIRSYADNAARFLDRGQTDKAVQNLGQIAELGRRMGRIIRNLRSFARAETGAVSDVDLAAVVQAVLEMLEARITQTGVTLNWSPPPAPVMVRGGEVRLQQVVLNLVTNALDAMEAAPLRELTLALTTAQDRVRLGISDTGTGIAEPDRIFDPFYSTKEVGQAEGMGLGLSIAYRIVESFDGSLAGTNAADGGAVFTLDLHAAHGREQAA